MAVINENGVVRRDLSYYVDEFERIFKESLGNDLSVEPQTPQGQLIGLLAIAFDELDAGVVDLANGKNLINAAGFQLDDIGSILNNRRRSGTYSNVMITFTGIVGTVIPANTRVRNSAGKIFATRSEATVGSNGTVSVISDAIEIGPVEAKANSLTILIESIGGITAVNNAAAAVLGKRKEIDSSYRQRLESQSMINSTSFVDAISNSVANVDNVKRIRILSNEKNYAITQGGVSIPAGAIRVVVQGGDDEDIANAIRNSKTIGVQTEGNTTVILTNPTGTYKFDRVTEIPLKITLRIDLTGGFPSNGISQIKNSLVSWVNNLLIGEKADKGRLYDALNIIPGYTVDANNLTIEKNPSSPVALADTDPNANELFTLSFDDIIITTTV